MAEIVKGIPFDANEIVLPDGEPGYDHVLFAQDFANWWATYFKNGILVPEAKNLASELKVTKTGDTVVKVFPGNMVVNGRTCFLESEKTLEIEKSVPNHERIDRVVVELNLINTVNDFRLLVLTGENAETPMIPALTRDDDVYQISLATLKINTTGIYQIVDDRPNDELCGISQVLIGVKPPVIEEAIHLSFDDSKSNLNAVNVQQAIDNLRGLVPIHVKSLLLAENWDAIEKTYSFEDNYPADSYDLSVEAIDCTEEQALVWSEILPIGSSESNVLTAIRKVPQIDIPVMLEISKKLTTTEE